MASLAALSSPTGSSQRADDSRDSVTSSKEDFSLPSSFSPSIDDGGNDAMIIHGKEGSVSTLEVYSQDDAKSVNSEQQLALRIDKETKPHHHLLRLLKEMDLGDESSDSTKNEAVASLIGDFERDVTLIQQKIQNEKLLKNTAENPAPLPPGWIALECPDTLDIYYVNEATGDTTWDRPGLDGEMNESILNDSVQSNDRSDQSESVVESDDDYSSSVENTLPPNWIALEDPDSGEMYYANEITGVTTWDRPEAHTEDSSNNEHSVSSGHDDKSQNEHSTLSVRFEDSSNAQSVSSQQNEEDLQTSSQQDDGTYNSSYISQSEEGSHSASYNDKSNNSDFHLSGQTSAEDDDDDDDDDLPEGWYSAIDPDSNERYYCNDETGESQWERPEHEQASQESSQPDEDHDESWQDNEDGGSDASGELPEGWEAILDPSSGEYYYCKWDGTTTWEKPVPDNLNQDTTQSDDGLPENWFAINDPASGDTYYYNEVTNETSWEIPTETNNLMSRLSVQENNNIVYEEDSVTSSKY
ncbi:WW domain-containing protein [Skeletonema marinoi]|uniref:WW domain-containing protein n=1 Tax=Skeletonema marinoi TaxID=267567 RepID=A0AAD8Y491_9STRA|nr:WW domain-containing protein [Skeletonema marinoi]